MDCSSGGSFRNGKCEGADDGGCFLSFRRRPSFPESIISARHYDRLEVVCLRAMRRFSAREEK